MRDRIQSMVDGWNRFWFAPSDPTTLAAVRICTGLVLLSSYIPFAFDLFSFIGPNAWIDAAALDQIRQPGGPAGDWWGWSIYFLTSSPSAIGLFYAAFLGTMVALTVGWHSRIAAALVWAGHLSVVHGGFLMWSGMDSVLAMLLFYLMFSPSGDALSIDRRSKPPRQSWSANLCIRLIQVHMCMIYLCAGLSKLQGARWWDGTAVWSVMMMQEFAPIDVGWLGRFGDVPCLIISNVGVLLTLGLEISFIFLIWNPRFRPALLTLAIVMHAGIGLFMGLSGFGAAMLTGCLAFVEPAAMRWLVDWCTSRIRPRFSRRFPEAHVRKVAA